MQLTTNVLSFQRLKTLELTSVAFFGKFTKSLKVIVITKPRSCLEFGSCLLCFDGEGAFYRSCCLTLNSHFKRIVRPLEWQHAMVTFSVK